MHRHVLLAVHGSPLEPKPRSVFEFGPVPTEIPGCVRTEPAPFSTRFRYEALTSDYRSAQRPSRKRSGLCSSTARIFGKNSAEFEHSPRFWQHPAAWTPPNGSPRGSQRQPGQTQRRRGQHPAASAGITPSSTPRRLPARSGERPYRHTPTEPPRPGQPPRYALRTSSFTNSSLPVPVMVIVPVSMT